MAITTAVVLKDANLNGLIREDVMDQIHDISQVPLPFTDLVGSGTHDNPYFEWRTDKLAAPTTSGALEDGQDISLNNEKVGRRMGNHSEIRGKRVVVSTRANEVGTIGYNRELSYQISRRQTELRRDIEKTLLSNKASVVAASGTAGQMAGLGAWLCADTDIDGTDISSNPQNKKNVYRSTSGTTSGADGGWDATASNSLVAAATPASEDGFEAITETKIRDVVESIYTKGGEPSVLMCRPNIKRIISEYMFTSSARIATNINDAPSGAAEQRQAQGSVDLFITDFGTLRLMSNRLMGEYHTDTSESDIAYILDPSMLSVSYLQGYRSEPQDKTGLSEKRQITVDVSLCVKNWDALGAVADIDADAAMTYS